MQEIKLDTRNLNAIKAFLIILIVCIHVSPDNLSTSKIIDSGLSIQVYISQVLSRIAVPLYFFFSGYLLSLNYNSFDSYRIKIKKRFKTLLIPFLLWNMLYAMFLFLVFKFAHISSFLDQEPSLVLKLYKIFIAPAISPLWFLRDLMLFQLVSIALFYIPKKFRIIVLTFLFVLWGIYFHFPYAIISVEGALFFVLGFYNVFPFYNFLKKHVKILLIITVIMSLTDVFIRYLGESYSLLFHRITVYLLCVLFVYTTTETGYFNKIYKKISVVQKYSFYIFVLHMPILSFVRRYLNSENLVSYLVMIVLSISLSIGIGFIISKFRNISNVLTGSR